MGKRSVREGGGKGMARGMFSHGDHREGTDGTGGPGRAAAGGLVLLNEAGPL